MIKIISKTIDISSMPAVLDYLMTLIEPDTEITLLNGNVPVAKLTSVGDVQQSRPARIPDLYPGLWVSEDFDDLLPGEYWLTEQL